MKEQISVAFISKKLKNEFESLKDGRFEDRQLYRFIGRAIEDIKQDPVCGTKIPKRLWPTNYIKNYAISNLWKYDLPDAWRLIYIIETNEVMIMNIILEWFDHKNYEKRFGYRKV